MAEADVVPPPMRTSLQDATIVRWLVAAGKGEPSNCGCPDRWARREVQARRHGVVGPPCDSCRRHVEVGAMLLSVIVDG